MTQQTGTIPPDTPPAAWDQGAETARADLFARIAQIEQASAHPQERGEALIRVLVESLGAIAGSAAFDVGGQECTAQITAGAQGAEAWMPVLNSAALEARSQGRGVARIFGSKTTAPEFVVLATPLDLAGRDPFGAAALLCRCKDHAHAERLQLHLRSASIAASAMLSRGRTRRPAVEMDDIARVLAKAGQYASLDQFAYEMTNAAKQRFNCTQAALGLVNRGKLRVACVSGLDHVKHRSPGVHQIEQAMGECVDARRPIVEQDRDRWEGGDGGCRGILHRRWRTACAGASVTSLPILWGDELVGVLSLRRPQSEPFDESEITAVQKLLTPLGAAIPLVARATRSLPSHARTSVRQSAHWACGRSMLRRKLLGLGVAGLIAWYAFAPGMYRVTTPGIVVAEREQVIAATVSAPIAEVLVEGGQRVSAGQPLLRIDTAQLETQAVALESEVERADVRIREAVAAGDPAAAATLNAERAVHLARLTDIRAQIHGATIHAPCDGIVTGERIADLQGRVVAQGEALLRIADEASLTLELLVPERRVTDLRPGAHLRFASNARPEDAAPSELIRLAPTGVERDGRTVFIARAPLPDRQDWLRPGMEGVAIVDAGQRPGWWRTLHRVIDTARLNFWID